MDHVRVCHVRDDGQVRPWNGAALRKKSRHNRDGFPHVLRIWNHHFSLPLLLA